MLPYSIRFNDRSVNSIYFTSTFEQEILSLENS
jgi:hypothetical protein